MVIQCFCSNSVCAIFVFVQDGCPLPQFLNLHNGDNVSLFIGLYGLQDDASNMDSTVP